MIKRFVAILILFLFTSFILLPWMSYISYATEGDITVTKLEIIPISGVIYKELSDTYIFGNESRMKIKITVSEKVISSIGNPRIDLLGAGFFGADEQHGVFAVFEGFEGDGNRTLVFTVNSGLYAKSNAITIPRIIHFGATGGRFLVEKVVGGDSPGTTKTIEKDLSTFNLNNLSSLTRLIYRNEWPTMKLTPEPSNISMGTISNGLTADYLIIDLNDKILDPSDFRIRYELWNLSKNNEKVVSEWMQCQERNLIPIPATYRNQNVQLFLELEDNLENYKPFTYVYMPRNVGGYSKIGFVDSSVMAGMEIRGLFTDYLYSNYLTPEVLLEMLNDAKNYFSYDVREYYGANYSNFFSPLAVFIFSEHFNGVSPDGVVTGTASDINIELCGYQWSPYHDRIDPMRPIQKFNKTAGDENIHRSTELAGGWGFRDGYWCIIDSSTDGITEDGTYFLHLVLADRVTGGVKEKAVYYRYMEGNPPQRQSEQVSFMRDNTPPKISITEDPDNPFLISVTLEDAFFGVGNTHLGISTSTGNTESRDFWDSGPWYELYPNLDERLKFWTYAMSKEDEGGKKVTFTMDRSEINIFPSGEFYLHVRTNDKNWDYFGWDNKYYIKESYATKSQYMDSSGFIVSGTSPNCTIDYSTYSLTNQPVTATISIPSDCRVINNGGSNTYTFYDNGSFTFKVRDTSGSEFDFVATVNHIDLVPPEIILNGPRTYSIYQGLAFDFIEAGYAAWDNISGDLTDQVLVESDINIYKGGYYEVVYTVTDQAGNTAREVRGISIYETNGINMYINNARIRGGESISKGQLDFTIIGLQSENYRLLYLPGRYKIGDFKVKGIPIINNSITLPTGGWYTFFIQDDERTTFIAPIELK